MISKKIITKYSRRLICASGSTAQYLTSCYLKNIQSMLYIVSENRLRSYPAYITKQWNIEDPIRRRAQQGIKGILNMNRGANIFKDLSCPKNLKYCCLFFNKRGNTTKVCNFFFVHKHKNVCWNICVNNMKSSWLISELLTRILLKFCENFC